MIVGIYEPSMRGVFSASSHYRSFGPLRKMPVQIREVQRTDNVQSLYTIDVLLASRPYEEVDVRMIQLAKDIGLPVWVDFDDDFWHIPHTNPAWKVYRGKAGIINQVIQLADVVTVSTTGLAESTKQQVPESSPVVIRNAVDNAIDAIEPEKTDKIRIGWRGTSTHSRDLEVWRNVFHKIAGKDNYELYFMGYPVPWNIPYKYVEPTDFFSFWKAFRKSGIDILLYPLEDCQFNHSKSNIAWLESTQIGAATITNLRNDEWSFKGIEHDVQKLFTTKVKDVNEFRRNLVSSSVESINANLTLQHTNVLRQQILDNLK